MEQENRPGPGDLPKESPSEEELGRMAQEEFEHLSESRISTRALFKELTTELSEARHRRQLDAPFSYLLASSRNIKGRKKDPNQEKARIEAINRWSKLRDKRVNFLIKNPDLFEELVKERGRAAIEVSQSMGIPPEEVLKNIDISKDLDGIHVAVRRKEEGRKSLNDLKEELLKEIDLGAPRDQVAKGETRETGWGGSDLAVWKESLRAEIKFRLEQDEAAGHARKLNPQFMMADKGESEVGDTSPNSSALCVVEAEDDQYYYGFWASQSHLKVRFPKKLARVLTNEEKEEFDSMSPRRQGRTTFARGWRKD
jgi:hypothetical protein